MTCSWAASCSLVTGIQHALLQLQVGKLLFAHPVSGSCLLPAAALLPSLAPCQLCSLQMYGLNDSCCRMSSPIVSHNCTSLAM